MSLALLVGLAGGLGSSLRYLVDVGLGRLLAARTDDAGRSPALPWATLLVNVAGSLALGAVSAAAAGGSLGGRAHVVLGVGLCGGFTTFSTAMVDVLRLGLGRRRGWAVADLLGTLVLCTGAAALGWLLAA